MDKTIPSFVAVDPGLTHTGVAVFCAGVLKHCFLSTSKKGTLGQRVRWHRACVGVLPGPIVVERMVARGKFSIVDAQDLIDLNLLAGALGNVWVTPNEWKGNVPRDVEQQRTWNALTEEERQLVPKLKSKSDHNHNVWSAVGIGLSVAQRAHKRIVVDLLL